MLARRLDMSLVNDMKTLFPLIVVPQASQMHPSRFRASYTIGDVEDCSWQKRDSWE